MGLKDNIHKRETEKMSEKSFKMMTFTFKIVDFIFRYIDKRVRKFGIVEGMTIVDYGCGPGRYTIRFAKLVGQSGKVYAVDIHELAIEAVKSKMEKLKFGNIIPLLVTGYKSDIPNNVADMVCAIDMFFIIKQPTEFLKELKRITKKEGILIIDDGHQSRSETKEKILNSEVWEIIEETRDHLKCRPR